VNGKFIHTFNDDLVKWAIEYNVPNKSVDGLLKNQIPCEFVHKPRSLDELPRGKATEYRLFLLYVGPIAIHSLALDKIYQHFLNLNIAMTVFLSPHYNHLAQLVKLLMHKIVKDFGSWFYVWRPLYISQYSFISLFTRRL